jgi:hypothetical protein
VDRSGLAALHAIVAAKPFQMIVSEIHVFTYKAGLLARVAHDLRLQVQRYDFTLRDGRLSGYCEAASLVVEGAMSPHGLDREALSEHDKQQILETVHAEILETERFPRVELDARLNAHAGSIHIEGMLTLRGRTLAIESDLRAGASDLWQASFEITPSRFGIPPYKALAGAIRLQDRVTVVVTLQLAGDSPASILENHNSQRLSPASSP